MLHLQDLPYNLKFVSFDHFHPLCQPLISLLWQPQSVFCIYEFCFFFFFIRFSIWARSHSICLFLSDISLSIMSLRSIHVVTNGRISFFLVAEYHSIVYIRHIVFIHRSVGGHLACFRVLGIENNAATNTGIQISFWVLFHFFWINTQNDMICWVVW